jgi:hypothetical protein
MSLFQSDIADLATSAGQQHSLKHAILTEPRSFVECGKCRHGRSVRLDLRLSLV